MLHLAQIWTCGTSVLYEGEMVQRRSSGFPVQIFGKRAAAPVEGPPQWFEAAVEAVEGCWPAALPHWPCCRRTATPPGQCATPTSDLQHYSESVNLNKNCLPTSFKRVEEALALYSTVYSQTLEAGRCLCETMSESRSQLQSECRAIEEAWERSTSLLGARTQLIFTAGKVAAIFFNTTI